MTLIILELTMNIFQEKKKTLLKFYPLLILLKRVCLTFKSGRITFYPLEA